MKFKVGNIVKCIRLDYPNSDLRNYIDKYFVVTNVLKNETSRAVCIDNRVILESISLFNSKWEKVSKEDYIILKLKGIINTEGVKYVE